MGDFFELGEMSVIESKIRGIEQEYPVSAAASFNPHFLVNLAIHGLRKARLSEIIRWDTSAEVMQEEHERQIESTFARNGCRIYNDLGHLEISSPSYNNPLDALAYERASEIYAFIASREATRSLTKRTFIHKNNVANFFSRGKIFTNTYATHGNIITLREVCRDWDRVERALIPWTISRIIFMGGGDVVSRDVFHDVRIKGDEIKDGIKFVISPRAMFVRTKSSLSTTVNRGILNTRDQPHASMKYWRLHDINYEALRCEYAILMRDLLETMVIRAFELGLLDDAPQIEDPVNTFKSISMDTQYCKWTVKLKNGEKTDIVDILYFYLDRIEMMYEEEEKGFWDEIGLKKMKKLFDDLKERKLENYVDGIDWVTKLAYLVNYEPKNASEGISLCNQYALIGNEVMFYTDGRGGRRGFFDPEESFKFAESTFDVIDPRDFSKRVKHALRRAPDRTRDFFRCFMMERFPSEIESISWGNISLRNAIIKLEEPFMLNKDEVESLGIRYDMSEWEVLSRAKNLYPEKIIFK